MHKPSDQQYVYPAMYESISSAAFVLLYSLFEWRCCDCSQIYSDLKEKAIRSSVNSKFDLYVRVADVAPLCLIHLKVYAHVISPEQPIAAALSSWMLLTFSSTK